MMPILDRSAIDPIVSLGQAEFPVLSSDGKEIAPKIKGGQGEYVVFHKWPNGETSELSEEAFEQVYQVLNACTPYAIASRSVSDVQAECKKRGKLIRAELKKIDPSLKAVFLPRTLYELIFMRQVIEEDLKNKQICLFSAYTKNTEARVKRKECWHLSCFTGIGNDQDAGVKLIAYKLNKVVFELLRPFKVNSCTFQEFSDLIEAELRFFEGYYDRMSHDESEMSGLIARYEEDLAKVLEDRNDFLGENSRFISHNPTVMCAQEQSNYVLRFPIHTDVDKRIIRNAVNLDCSLGQEGFLLFRGANHEKDSPTSIVGPYVLSYGTSLFSGCMYDSFTVAYAYMRSDENDGMAIVVPFDQLAHSPFFIPPTNAVVQLVSKGCIFHAKSKIWKGGKALQSVARVSLRAMGEAVCSNLEKDEFIEQFNLYKSKAVNLKI